MIETTCYDMTSVKMDSAQLIRSIEQQLVNIQYNSHLVYLIYLHEN